MTAIVDSRRCGEGKTYDNTPTPTYHQGRVLSTWSNIKYGWQLGYRYLVVLPSLALCDAYELEFINFLNEECPGHTNQLAKITSSNAQNVQRQLHEELDNRCAVIIITQAAFLQSSINSLSRQQYNLIIDEAVMPYREIPVYHEKECFVDFKWNENTSLLEPIDGAVEWKILNFYNLQGNFITDAAEQTRYLFNTNWQSRCHVDDYAKFADPIPKTERMSIIQELLPSLFDHWLSIWVACAAFEYTFMSRWMTEHNIPWKIHNKLKFKPHEVTMNIHGPEDKFTWSSYKQDNEPELIQQYKTQATSIAQDDGVLVLRNTTQTRQVFKNEELLPHNSAGNNKWKNFEYVSLESALNATPNMTRFLRDVYGIDRENNLDVVHMAQTVYTFYQTLMRSCLRSGKPATVFCLDNRVILGLGEFFNDINYKELTLIRKDVNPVGRPIKTNKLTNAQQQKCQRRRDKYPDLAGKSNNEIWDLLKTGAIK
jgi:hypothetical protein